MSERKKVLVVGSGGREHTIVSAIARSPSQPEIYCAPGNAGISEEAQCVDIAGDDIERLLDFARNESIDLTIVGPEAPLVAGIVDLFEGEGLKIFGPGKGGAQLEGSKIFCKEFLCRHEIPTAAFEIFDDSESALAHVNERPLPMVVKADGLAAGKGVIVAHDRATAAAAVKDIMVDRSFGEAGARVLIEDCLTGSEISIMALTDGTHYLPLETAQDYKPAFDGNEGPNTGGMGSYSPYYSLGDPLVQNILDRVIRKTVEGLAQEGLPFKGVLYAGIMLTEDGPMMLEYNARFGDPETQSILSRLKTDPLAVFEAASVPGGLENLVLEWDERDAVCIVAASGGYPGSYDKGLPITGIDKARENGEAEALWIYHAGTGQDESGTLVTAGGRVLGITALGDNREAARAEAYKALESISFEGLHSRSDIGTTMAN
ncbi:MAG: phosphoribosylamine--glycine ligase [Planctomycetota bacterium]